MELMITVQGYDETYLHDEQVTSVDLTKMTGMVEIHVTPEQLRQLWIAHNPAYAARMKRKGACCKTITEGKKKQGRTLKDTNLAGRRDMRYIITANDGKLFYAGRDNKDAGRGIGSGAFNLPEKVPRFSENKDDLKVWSTRVDAKRTIGGIVDAVCYGDVEGIKSVKIVFEDD